MSLLIIFSFLSNCVPLKDGITIYESCDGAIGLECTEDEITQNQMQTKKYKKFNTNKPIYSKRAEAHCRRWNRSAQIKSINQRTIIGNTVLQKYHEVYVCR